jgi:hypothetical protein
MANNGTEVIQVELVSPTPDFPSQAHTVTWIEASLRPAKGMKLACGKDPRVWTVHEAYTRTPVRMEGINSSWKVGGL